jgi:hypothetical protein
MQVSHQKTMNANDIVDKLIQKCGQHFPLGIWYMRTKIQPSPDDGWMFDCGNECIYLDLNRLDDHKYTSSIYNCISHFATDNQNNRKTYIEQTIGQLSAHVSGGPLLLAAQDKMRELFNFDNGIIYFNSQSGKKIEIIVASLHDQNYALTLIAYIMALVVLDTDPNDDRGKSMLSMASNALDNL